jgi:hypothetical protein
MSQASDRPLWLPHRSGGYHKDDRVYTALNRPAIILHVRADGLLDARYEDGENRWASLTTLNPKHCKRRP